MSRTRGGSLLLAWCWTPLHLLPVHAREAVIRSWHTANLKPLRLLARNICFMAQQANVMRNPKFKQITGYSDVAMSAGTRFPILRKPFELAGLERAVREALSGEKAKQRA